MAKRNSRVKYAPVYQRRYLRRGVVAHIVRVGFFDPHALDSICGLSHDVLSWLGTGTYEEIERASKLPTCSWCKRGLS